MRNYDYNKLLDARTFEYFAKDLIEIREDKEFEIFSEGKDKGIDLRNIEKGFITIVQVKRNKNFGILWNELKNELKKVKKLGPDRYILITSSPISVENEEKIIDLFKGCNLEEKDIIGCEKLNGMLEKPEYKRVEDEYYQLWINSTRTLENFIKKSLNADTYAFTNNELDNIKQSAEIYVRHDKFKEALGIIKEKRCLLICGEPELGKSTLARNLCAYLMNQNKELEFIVDTKLSTIVKLFDDHPQLFFVDDFWGSRFDGNLNAEEENELKIIIQMINKSKNKILILTSREYILEQRYAKYPELKAFFEQYKLNLYVDEYSDLFKARVLFKHLENSILPVTAIYQIANGYKWIIHNQNYRPRLIENYINYVSDKEIEPINYLEDFVDYLNHPYKLWEEIFEKQHEGAQIITILMLLLNKEYIKIEHVRNLYESYIDYDTKTTARKKDFLKYISQLENTLITTYTEEWISEKDIFVKFKNSSIELYIYKYLVENIGEYGKNIIESTPYINTLMYFVGSWKVLEEYQEKIAKEENIYYDITKNVDLIENAKAKIMRDLDNLIFIDEDLFEGYCESDENYVHKLVMCINIYKKYPSEEFKEFIKTRITKVLKEIEEDKYFDYSDLFSIPRLVKQAKETKIYTELNINKIIEDAFSAIRFSRQIFILKDFEKSFPEEYEKFYNKNKSKVISLIYNLTLDDAEFFMSDAMYDEIDTLKDETIPELFEKFNLKYTKEYMNEFYDITDIRLLADKRKDKKQNRNIEIEYEDIREKEINEIIEKENREKELIEREKRELIDMVLEDDMKEYDVKEYFDENIEDKKIAKELAKLFNNYSKNYIREFMKNIEAIELLTGYINDIKRVPKDSNDFFKCFIEYIIRNNLYINKTIITKLKQIAYNTFKEGRCNIFKRELLEKFDEIQIKEILESKLMYKIRNKYYFQTKQLHIYFAIDKMIENKEELSNICEVPNFGIFGDMYNDICYTYSDINLEEFNKNFLLKQIEINLKEFQSENKDKIIEKIVAKYKIEVELDVNIDIEREPIYQGGSCIPDLSLIAMEYLGFDMWDMICEPFDLEEIKTLFLRAYKSTSSTILLEQDLLNKRTLKYKVLKKLGYPKYLNEFYKHLLECKMKLEENPNLDLRMSFNI